MRIIALFVICMFSGAAIAQTSECQSIHKASDRLACYDRAAPSTTMDKPAKSKTPTALDKPEPSNTAPDQERAVDVLAVENSKLDAKLKTICRGC